MGNSGKRCKLAATWSNFDQWLLSRNSWSSGAENGVIFPGQSSVCCSVDLVWCLLYIITTGLFLCISRGFPSGSTASTHGVFAPYVKLNWINAAEREPGLTDLRILIGETVCFSRLRLTAFFWHRLDRILLTQRAGHPAWCRSQVSLSETNL